jgi:hypothetical protein
MQTRSRSSRSTGVLPSMPVTAVLIRPIAKVAIWAFDMNHSGPRCHTLPCRSFSGTNDL